MQVTTGMQAKLLVIHNFWPSHARDFPSLESPVTLQCRSCLPRLRRTATSLSQIIRRPRACPSRPHARSSHGSVPPPGLCQFSTMPRMKKCYGWLTIPGKAIWELPWSLRAPPVRVDKVKRSLAPDQEYIAIVYEYGEEGENDADTMQKVIDFLWLAGFDHCSSPHLRNWKGGVLVDLCDFAPPRGYCWQPKRYEKGPDSAHLLLQKHRAAELRTGMPAPKIVPADRHAVNSSAHSPLP